MEGFDDDHVRQVLGIPAHLRVVFLLAVGRLLGEDGRHPGRFPLTHTVFVNRYGRQATSGQVRPVESAQVRADRHSLCGDPVG